MKIFKLGDVCLLSKGKTITRATANEGEVPVIGGGLGPTYFHNIANRKPPVITISASGANAGFVNYWDSPIWASDCTTIVEKPESPALIDYIFKYLQSRQEFINTELRRGSAQPHVYPSDIADLELPLPSLEKQREIVEKLDIAFAEIDLLEENLGFSDEKTNQLLQSLLSAAFTSSRDTVDPGNPSANQGFAMNFSVKPLGELSKLTMGRTPPRGNSKYWDSSRKTKNIWISIADMTKSLDGTLIDSKEYLSDEGSKTFPKVKMGTLLLSFKLSIGKLAIAGTDLQTNEAIMAMNELNEDLILQDYLYYFLFGFDWSEALEGRSKVKGNTLNKKILEELPIKFPSLEKQREIVEKLDSAFAEIELLKAQIKIEQDYATALRQSLLSSAFTQEEAVA